jgi:DtxR family Mn-dependent transcriptional regulator
MQNSGLVSFGEDLKLTEKGLCLAKIITRRHRITERFLSEVLNLPWNDVYEESSRWENILSPTTEKAMLEILGNPTTGPFGNPIPYSGYKEKEMYRLLDVDSKKTYYIEKITEELKRDSAMIAFLQSHHMVPGTKVSIADTGDFSITISTDKNNYFGIDKYIAKRVYVV